MTVEGEKNGAQMDSTVFATFRRGDFFDEVSSERTSLALYLNSPATGFIIKSFSTSQHHNYKNPLEHSAANVTDHFRLYSACSYHDLGLYTVLW